MMNYIPKGDNYGGAVCDDPHVRFCERPMDLFMGLLDLCCKPSLAGNIALSFDFYNFTVRPSAAEMLEASIS